MLHCLVSVSDDISAGASAAAARPYVSNGTGSVNSLQYDPGFGESMGGGAESLKTAAVLC